MVTIISGILSEERVKAYIKQDEKLIIKTPPDSLVELYLMSGIPQFIGLRAESDYSIENEKSFISVSEIAAKKLGKYNPNYGTCTTLIKNVCQKKTLEHFINLVNWLSNFIPKMELIFTRWENYCYSCKHCNNLQECLDFIVTYYNIL